MIGQKAVKVRISGVVQGVYYRGWTVEAATSRGLDGWVRNRIDGTVEALFAGHETGVDEMIRLCHEGPPAARVTAVKVDPAQGVVAKGFNQKPTV